MRNSIRSRKKTEAKDPVTWIIGVDEAGRGPLAGPVYVGVCAVPVSFAKRHFRDVTDSKKIPEKKRNELYAYLKNHNEIHCEVACSTAQTINKIGIVSSVDRALQRALKKLALPPTSCSVLLDGGLTAPSIYVRQKTIIHGDAKEKIIGAASILAKVSRDKVMRRYDNVYKEYGFSTNKGYGTRAHIEAIRVYGLTAQHRKGFCRSALEHVRQKEV